tara:strand:- start:27 stop:578 length:552 start_codon:yes stop_codon:yes gene_type:complete
MRKAILILIAFVFLVPSVAMAQNAAEVIEVTEIKKMPFDWVALCSMIITFGAVVVAIFLPRRQGKREKQKDAKTCRAGALLYLETIRSSFYKILDDTFENYNRKNFDALESLIPLSVSLENEEQKLFLYTLHYFKTARYISSHDTRELYLKKISNLIECLGKRSDGILEVKQHKIETNHTDSP